MLSTLEIHNFQSWKHVIIKFCKGLIVFKGTSGKGKSSIIRAIYWALKNRPISEDMRPWSDEDKKLTISSALEFDNGDWLSRIRDPKFNGYETSNSTSSLEALHGDVPEEISLIANMAENIHMQDDGYFLLNESPGEVARILNRKSGLEDIDIIDKATKSILKELSSELKATKKGIKEKKEKLKEFEGLKELKPKFEELESLFNQQRILDNKIKGLDSIIIKLKLYSAQIHDLDKFLTIVPFIKEIKRLIVTCYYYFGEHIKITNYISNINNLQKTIDTAKKNIKVEPYIIEISGLIIKYQSIYNQNEILKKLILKIKFKDFSILKKEKEKEKLEALLPILKEKLTYCPSCGADKQYWKERK